MVKQHKVCQWCGETLKKPRTTYCSDDCMKNMKIYNNSVRKRYKCKICFKEHDYISLIRLFKYDGGICYLCGKKLEPPEDKNYNPNDESAPQVDHVIPVSKCGRHLWSNVKLICKKCNSYKSNLLLCPCIYKNITFNLNAVND